MKKLIVLIVGLLSIQSNAQQIDTAYVQPANPTVNDNVHIYISGYHNSSDAYIGNIAVQFYGDSINITLEYAFLTVGLPVLVPYDTLVELGNLATGDWIYHIGTMVEFQNDVDTFNGEFTVINPTGLDEANRVEKGKAINYPNPFKDVTTIELNMNDLTSSELEIYNMQGQLIRVIDVDLQQAENRITLNLSFLQAGRYIYRLGEVTGEFIKK